MKKSAISPHHRITLSDVERDYHDGLLTAKGAIFYAVCTMRRLGYPVRINPKEFCDRHPMHLSTFYKKVAQLNEKFRLEFESTGEMVLKVPIADAEGTPAYYFFSELSPQSENLSPQSENLSPQSENKPPKSRRAKRSKLSQSDLSDQSLSPLERDTAIDPEFRRWLENRAALLPKPPALLNQWVERQAKLQVNRAEYAAETEARARASVPATASAQIFDDRSMEQQRLDTLQHWWDDGEQVKVKAAIESHPEWGLTIGEFGPEVGNNASS